MDAVTAPSVTVVQAVVLGILQGVGEFLPISSTAHLTLAPWLLGWPDPGLSFDVALHMGTLAAVLLFFWREWVAIAVDGLLRGDPGRRRLFAFLVAASVPGALAGLLLQDAAATVFRAPVLVAVALIVMGWILYWADARRGRGGVDVAGMSLGDALVIGLSQAVAIVPGVSRSGATMTAGLLRGLSREAAARFSFLMSMPIILGAGVLQLRHLTPSALGSAPFWAGVAASAVAGLMSIGFLLRFLRTGSFRVFAWYRFILGLIVIVVAVLRG